MNFVKFMVEIRPRITSLIKNIDTDNKRIVFDNWLNPDKNLEMYNQRRDLAYRLTDNLVILIDFFSEQKHVFCTEDIKASGGERNADFIFGFRIYDELKSETIFYVNVWYNFDPVEALFYQIGDGRVRSTMTQDTYFSLDDDKVIMWSLESDQPVLNNNLDQLLDLFKMEESNV